jgi:hypothetical protein
MASSVARLLPGAPRTRFRPELLAGQLAQRGRDPLSVALAALHREPLESCDERRDGPRIPGLGEGIGRGAAVAAFGRAGRDLDEGAMADS